MRMKMNQKRTSESINLSQIPMSILGHLQQPVLVLDRDGRVVIWNASMERYSGVAAGTIIGKGDYAHAEALIGERRPTPANAILTRHERRMADHDLLSPPGGDETFVETRIPLTSGRVVGCTAAPLYDPRGGVVGAVEIFHDVPEEVPDPGDASPSPVVLPREQVQALARSLPDLFFTLNRDGIFTQFVWSGAREVGVDPDEIVGRTPQALLPEEEADFLARAARRVIERDLIVSETRSFLWHGKQRSFLVAIHPLHDSAGRCVAATGVARDITRELFCEQTLQETGRLSSLYLDLLSTDIYNTSMVAATVIEMLRERLSGEEAELAQRVKNTIEQGITVIKNVELLTSLNKHRIHVEPVDLDRIVRGQIERYAGIDIHYEGGTCMVWANPLLEHIVSNLLSNSIKFGGMKVRIDITVTETGDIVTLTVADTGIGIPDHLKPNIFDRFSRGGKPSSGSRGLGLHIVKTLVNQYGGRVWAADRVPGRPEEGAAIKVILQKC